MSFTLKDFVSIFKADKIGEKISNSVLQECLRRQERKRLEEQAIMLQHHNQNKAKEILVHNA